MANGNGIPWELSYALRVLLDESIGDQVYSVRDRELKGWEGPRVTAYSQACGVIGKYAAPPEATKQPPTERDVELARLREERATLDAKIAEMERA